MENQHDFGMCHDEDPDVRDGGGVVQQKLAVGGGGGGRLEEREHVILFHDCLRAPSASERERLAECMQLLQDNIHSAEEDKDSGHEDGAIPPSLPAEDLFDNASKDVYGHQQRLLAILSDPTPSLRGSKQSDLVVKTYCLATKLNLSDKDADDLLLFLKDILPAEEMFKKFKNSH